jgi:hypothetical protein
MHDSAAVDEIAFLLNAMNGIGFAVFWAMSASHT